MPKVAKIMGHLWRFKATIAYILSIIFINSLFTYVPPIFVLNQWFSPADIVVGSVYIFRDFSQREIKDYVLLAMIVGGLLSYLFAAKGIAFASLIAFLVGESIDWMLFTWTKKPLSQRLLLSALCSCPFDSLVFLYLIHRLSVLEFSVITLGKFIGVIVVWWYWKFKTSETPMTEINTKLA